MDASLAWLREWYKHTPASIHKAAIPADLHVADCFVLNGEHIGVYNAVFLACIKHPVVVLAVRDKIERLGLWGVDDHASWQTLARCANEARKIDAKDVVSSQYYVRGNLVTFETLASLRTSRFMCFVLRTGLNSMLEKASTYMEAFDCVGRAILTALVMHSPDHAFTGALLKRFALKLRMPYGFSNLQRRVAEYLHLHSRFGQKEFTVSELARISVDQCDYLHSLQLKPGAVMSEYLAKQKLGFPPRLVTCVLCGLGRFNELPNTNWAFANEWMLCHQREFGVLATLRAYIMAMKC